MTVTELINRLADFSGSADVQISIYFSEADDSQSESLADVVLVTLENGVVVISS